MKKIVLSIFAGVFLILTSLAAFAGSHKSIFSNSTSTLFFNGALKTANVTVRSIGTRSHKILHRIARNRRGPDNMTVAFDNESGTVAGTVSFSGDGVWLGFNGSFVLKQAERVLSGQTMGTGVIKLNKNDTLSYDPATGAFTGSGEIVQFTGSVDMAGVMRSDGNRAMVKLKIHPATAVMQSVFTNGTTVIFGNGTTVSVRFSVPALQMRRLVTN